MHFTTPYHEKKERLRLREEEASEAMQAQVRISNVSTYHAYKREGLRIGRESPHVFVDENNAPAKQGLGFEVSKGVLEALLE